MPVATGVKVMRNAIVTVADVPYTNQVTKARLVPDQPIQTLRTLVPDGAITDVDSAVWTLELAGVQSTLATALRTASGTQVEVVLQPDAGDAQPTATFSIIALTPPFGGDQGAFRVFDMTFPVVGEPVFGTSDEEA